MIQQTIIPPSGDIEPSFPYGSVIARFLAMLVDWVIVFSLLLILFIPLFILSLIGSLIVAPLLALFNLTMIPSFFAMYALALWIYYATMESSDRGATYGKRLFGLRVCDQGGGRISFVRASLRAVAKVASAFPFMLGFVMAFVTHRKQALHDLIVETLVIKG